MNPVSNDIQKHSYRAEIDGLRAIAVVSVILYHAKFVVFGNEWLTGGFIGVDVFFVISGYLITRIILTELYEKGTFSFANFYARRARRIFPMLFTVILFSIPFAWQKLLPQEFVEYAKSVLYSISFGSNFFFYFNTTEYGADSALLKPFLHTWSLGVEEQFYLVFPILALLVFKVCRSRFLDIIIVLSILSFVFSVFTETINPDLNFFLPFSRFWELAFGSILAFKEISKGQKNHQYLSRSLPLVGLSMIIYSVLYFDSATPHPSFATIIPILGVGLLIGFCSKDDWVGKVLGSKPFVWIGLISYSAYLWHFPIFAFSRLGSSSPTTNEKIVWILLTLALSVISYFVIEKPFRRKISSRTFFRTMAVTLALIVIGAGYVVKLEGVPSFARLGYNVNVVNSIVTPKMINGAWCGGSKIKLKGIVWCQLGDKEKQEIDFILIGDSHSQSATTLMENLGADLGLKGLYAGTTGCPALLGIYPIRHQAVHPTKRSMRCFKINQKAFEIAKEHQVQRVILIARWDYYVDGSDSGNWRNITDTSLVEGDLDHARQVYDRAVSSTVARYSELDTRLVVMLQIPHQNIKAKRIFEELVASSSSVKKSTDLLETAKQNFISKVDHKNRQAIANASWLAQESSIKNSSLVVIDPTDVFCQDGVCAIFDGEESFYYDADHASTVGFARLRAQFEEALTK